MGGRCRQPGSKTYAYNQYDVRKWQITDSGNFVDYVRFGLLAAIEGIGGGTAANVSFCNFASAFALATKVCTPSL